MPLSVRDNWCCRLHSTSFYFCMLSFNLKTFLYLCLVVLPVFLELYDCVCTSSAKKGKCLTDCETFLWWLTSGDNGVVTPHFIVQKHGLDTRLA